MYFNGLAVVTVQMKKSKKGSSLKTRVTLHGVPDPDGTLVMDLEEALDRLTSEKSHVPGHQELEEEIHACVRRLVRRRQERKPQVQTLFLSP